MTDEPDNRFAFVRNFAKNENLIGKGPKVTRRSFIGSGAARAVVPRAAAAEADPLIEEAEHLGHQLHAWESVSPEATDWVRGAVLP